MQVTTTILAVLSSVTPLLAAAQAATAGSAPVTVVNATPLSVTVANPTASPIPVTVSNLGTTTAVSGTVTTQDIDNPARHPWQRQFTPDVSSISVALEQRLTIEFVSAECETVARQPPRQLDLVRISTTAGGVNLSHSIPLTYSFTQNETDFYYAALAVRIYADPGSTVNASWLTYPFMCVVTLSGNSIAR